MNVATATFPSIQVFEQENMNQKHRVFEFLIQVALRESIDRTGCQISSNHSGNKVS